MCRSDIASFTMSWPHRLQSSCLGKGTKQSGSAMIIAVFIIVVMAVLATSLNKNIASSTSQVTNEVLGTRALLAAEAANERALVALFPLDGSAPACPVGDQQFYFTGIGFNQCVALTSCTTRTTADGSQYFRIGSTGVCKSSFVGSNNTPNLSDVNCLSSDKVCVSRTVEVEAKAL